MVFDGIKGPPGVQIESVVDNSGATTLTITIPDIYREDADDADALIFIDVRTKEPRNVNAKFLAIFPIKHPLLQTCTPCPNDLVANNYASTGLEVCVGFQGARRANISTTLPKIAVRSIQTPTDNATTLLLDSIAGFELRRVVYSSRSSRVQNFIQMNPQMAILHKEHIQLDVALFFGIQALSNTSFSFGLADLININTPSSVLQRQVRRLLQAVTSSSPSEESLDIVGISMQSRDPSPLPAPEDANVYTITTTIGIVMLVLFLACIVTVFITCVYITCKSAEKHTANRQDQEHHPFLQQPAGYD